ncbi:hypothetical protein [Aequorivita marisscotiae]|uniref:DUF3887 domain-containing protein n=1 Tax=Aequorivita marisscotiae TaxID=3040348 RepID=A0ABY8KWW8_9FLAO|nr:hypothetical protein [Aequorivita sp. Ant34-E75]WGF93886.1 hypothetical protein QCQ61_06785 [Aequorivita sp. Ant34-E75]
MMKKSLIILVLVASQFMVAQNSPKEMAATFFVNYQNEGASIAIDKLYSSNKWMEQATEAITNLKNKLEGLNENYVGQYYGYELIGEKKLAESYVLLSYLVKFDRQPIRYTFQFYKPDQTWILYSFKFDSDIDKEIEEAAKLMYLD